MRYVLNLDKPIEKTKFLFNVLECADAMTHEITVTAIILSFFPYSMMLYKH